MHKSSETMGDEDAIDWSAKKTNQLWYDRKLREDGGESLECL